MALNYIGNQSSRIQKYTYAPGALIANAAVTLFSQQSGGIISFSFPSTAFTYTFTLPAIASSSGIYYRFVVNTVPSILNGSIAITCPDGALIYCNDSNIAITTITSNTTVALAAMGISVGDHIDLYCDGARWIVQSVSGDASFTVA